MDRFDRVLRGGCMVLIAALMAGCSAGMLAQALGLSVPWVWTYLLALGAAGMVRLIHRGGGWALGVGAALAVAVGAMLADSVPKLAQLVQLLSTGADATAVEAARDATGISVALFCAFLFGALLAELMRAPSGAPFALLVLLASVVFALAAQEEISLWTALPGLVAGVAAFGLPSDARRDGVPPVLLVPALLLAALAIALTPAERVTWGPLEQLAERVRAIVEDYIRFTEERMAFSIGEKGYDRAGMIGDQVVSMLGGPANPTHDAVMRVHTDVNLLLRGTIKRSYTGYSWVDDQPKARYLYYDITHRGVRADAFDVDTNEGNSAFALRAASVEMLGRGTSTLFVPGQLASFEMGLEDAVYYNSAGELFLTRDVGAGDHYKFTARIPQSEEALVLAAQMRAGDADEGFAQARENYGALPPGIDSRVYALAVELTQDVENAAEKAFAIQNYLAQNYRYTLDGNSPPAGADFVSWFLLEERAGYCSYFASAMTVMCRMVGLPARYVEGYSVEAVPGGEALVTGEDAHAWVEVYLNGMGWIAFDPTAAAQYGQGGSNGGSGGGGESPDSGESAPPSIGDTGTPTPEPSPTPTPESEITPTPEPDGGAQSPAPEDGDAPDETPDESEAPNEDSSGDGENDEGDSPAPENEPSPPPDPPQNERDNHWLWLLLLLLALAILIGLSARWARRRLRDTDPLALSAKPEDADRAALILYRATLTLLNQLGYAPQSGETPAAFAGRVRENLGVEDYLRFAQGLARCRYAGAPADAALLKDGRSAYRALLNALPPLSRARYHMTRLFRGLGDIESIP